MVQGWALQKVLEKSKSEKKLVAQNLQDEMHGFPFADSTGSIPPIGNGLDCGKVRCVYETTCSSLPWCRGLWINPRYWWNCLGYHNPNDTSLFHSDAHDCRHWLWTIDTDFDNTYFAYSIDNGCCTIYRYTYIYYKFTHLLSSMHPLYRLFMFVSYCTNEES